MSLPVTASLSFLLPPLNPSSSQYDDYDYLKHSTAITFSTIILIVNTVTICGNSLVIAAFIQEPRVRMPRNYYILNLALTDLCTALFAVPLYTSTLIYGEWPFGNVFCAIWMSLNLMARLETSFTIFLITHDRYRMVKDPLGYRTRVGQKCKVLILILVSWIMTFFMRVPFIIFSFLHGVKTDQEILCSPHAHFDAPFRIGLPVYDMTYTIVSACVEFFIPLICIIYWNIQVYRKIKHQATRVTDSLIVATIPIKQHHRVGKSGTTQEHPTHGREIVVEDDPDTLNLESMTQDVHSSTRVVIEHYERHRHSERRSSYAITHNVTLDVHVSHALGTVILDSIPHNHPYFHSTIAAECKIQVKRVGGAIKGKSRQNASKGKSAKSRRKYAEKYSVDSLELSSGFSCTSIGRKLSLDEQTRELACSRAAVSELNDDIESAIMGKSPTNKIPSEDESDIDPDTVKKQLDQSTSQAKQQTKYNDKTSIALCKYSKDNLQRQNTEGRESSSHAVTLQSDMEQDGSHRDIMGTTSQATPPLVEVHDNKTQPQLDVQHNKLTENIQEDTGQTESVQQRPLATKNSLGISDNSNNTKRNMKRAALILIVITIMFIVCRTPYVVGRLMAVACDTCIEDAVYQSMFWLGWGLALLNPFLYAFISTAFRQYCVNLFKKVQGCCGRCCHHTCTCCKDN